MLSISRCVPCVIDQLLFIPSCCLLHRSNIPITKTCLVRLDQTKFYLHLIRNGDTYSGEYFADKMHGFGVYKFANGHRYEGAWHEGKRQGLGMYTFRNGEQQSGHWQNGVLDIPSTQNTTYPVSPVGVYHSKILNAVQVIFILQSRHLIFVGRVNYYIF